MTAKNKIEVLIGGKVYTIVGDESEEYMQRIALYIDKKMDEVNKAESSKALSTNMVTILTSINVADDLFKTNEECNKLFDNVQELEKDKENLKQRLEEFEEELLKVQCENIEYEKLINDYQLEIMRLKSELNYYNKEKKA